MRIVIIRKPFAFVRLALRSGAPLGRSILISRPAGAAAVLPLDARSAMGTRLASQPARSRACRVTMARPHRQPASFFRKLTVNEMQTPAEDLRAEPASRVRSGPHDGPRLLHSRDLLFGRDEIQIEHEGQLYRLRRTKLGKLILTK
jgi:hemin uptake protein HemP